MSTQRETKFMAEHDVRPDGATRKVRDLLEFF
jgi:hypothetical protein